MAGIGGAVFRNQHTGIYRSVKLIVPVDCRFDSKTPR
jgi:hypothetical protein